MTNKIIYLHTYPVAQHYRATNKILNQGSGEKIFHISSLGYIKIDKPEEVEYLIKKLSRVKSTLLLSMLVNLNSIEFLKKNYTVIDQNCEIHKRNYKYVLLYSHNYNRIFWIHGISSQIQFPWGNVYFNGEYDNTWNETTKRPGDIYIMNAPHLYYLKYYSALYNRDLAYSLIEKALLSHSIFLNELMNKDNLRELFNTTYNEVAGAITLINTLSLTLKDIEDPKEMLNEYINQISGLKPLRPIPEIKKILSIEFPKDVLVVNYNGGVLVNKYVKSLTDRYIHISDP